MAETAGTSTNTPIDENQIAVATAHVGMVMNVLEEHGVIAGVRDDSKELGLTLLALPDEPVRRAGREGSTDPLGDLLAQTYETFENRYGGWVPTIGRNRRVLPVTGAHNIGGGDACAPTMADLQLRPRNAEPGYGVKVGIADTALYAHPWLAGAFQAAPASMWDDLGGSPDFSSGHATFVAGLILQRAPGVTLEARRVLGDNGQADSWDVAKDLVRFARTGLDVLNLSFGCFTDDNKAPLVLSTALDRLDSRVVVVAAAGNQGATADRSRPMWPAALDEVVGVATMDGEGRRPSWSPDPDLPWIDATARGEDVTSTYLAGKVDLHTVNRVVDEPFNGYARWSGTSFSAAQVSGAIAASVVAGETGAATALAELKQSAARPSGSSVPWIR
jgi:subtilisin family serine protease